MQVQVEREIFIRASRSHAVLNEAIQLFKGYLEATTSPQAPEYYRARNFLKESARPRSPGAWRDWPGRWGAPPGGRDQAWGLRGAWGMTIQAMM